MIEAESVTVQFDELVDQVLRACLPAHELRIMLFSVQPSLPQALLYFHVDINQETKLLDLALDG